MQILNRIEFYLEQAERRNADSYQPDFITSEVIEKFLNKDGWYVSFTSVPKLGINPRSRYNTPLAIYCYPIKEAYKKYTIGKRGPLLKGTHFLASLPFAADAKYAWIFNVKSGHIVHTTAQVPTYNDKVPDILKFFNSEPLKIPQELLDIFNREFPKEIDPSTPLTVERLYWRTYNMLKQVYNYIGTDDEDDQRDLNQARPPTLIATKIFRICGIDMIVDNKSLIHENEPVQAAIFNPAIIGTKILTINRKIQSDVGHSPNDIYGTIKKYFANKSNLDKHWSIYGGQSDALSMLNVLAAKDLGLGHLKGRFIAIRPNKKISIANEALVKFITKEVQKYIAIKTTDEFLKNEDAVRYLRDEFNSRYRRAFHRIKLDGLADYMIDNKKLYPLLEGTATAKFKRALEICGTSYTFASREEEVFNAYLVHEFEYIEYKANSRQYLYNKIRNSHGGITMIGLLYILILAAYRLRMFKVSNDYLGIIPYLMALKR